MNDLPPVLLRSFVAVADTLNFTAAAARRKLGQPAISQHVRRLEQLVGRPLLRRSTRHVQLTADGAAMAGFARDILAAQDRALAHYASATLRGTLRLGVTEDLSLTRLPEILRRFRRNHSEVDLQLVVGLSSPLANQLNAGELDLLFIKRLDPAAPGILVWREPLVWFAAPDLHLPPDGTVPLVSFPGASITRHAAIAALERGQRPWRQSVVSQSLPALLAALRAGFGVSAQVSLLARDGLRAVPVAAGLPALPAVDFVLLERPTGAARPAMAEPAGSLVRLILKNRDEIASWAPGAPQVTLPAAPPAE